MVFSIFPGTFEEALAMVGLCFYGQVLMPECRAQNSLPLRLVSDWDDDIREHSTIIEPNASS
jgi:hypothetical protein